MSGFLTINALNAGRVILHTESPLTFITTSSPSAVTMLLSVKSEAATPPGIFVGVGAFVGATVGFEVAVASPLY